MPKIEIPEDDLWTRGEAIPKLLRPITKDDPYCSFKGGTTFCRFGAHEKVVPKSEMDEWRLEASLPGFWISYREDWGLSPLVRKADRRWYLARAYLHLFRLGQDDDPDDEQLTLCVHCEPNLEPDDKAPSRDKYKIGPHMHIEEAPHPLPKIHFGLNMLEQDQVLRSMDNLTRALRSTIVMLQEEVFAVYAKTA